MNTIAAHLGDDILNAWIDGVATEQEQAVVHDHVATCDVCQQRLDELVEVKAMLASLPKVAPPRSFRLTPDQAKGPTPLRPAQELPTILRLLPIVRSLSVAAIFAVMVLGGVLAFGPTGDTIDSGGVAQVQRSETDGGDDSLESENPAPRAAQEPGEIVDQGEAASAHDSTSDALSDDARETGTSSLSSEDGLTALEIATIAIGVIALLLAATWTWISMTIRAGTRR